MKVVDTGIAGLKVIEPDVHFDDRGYFFETYNSRRFAEAGIKEVFVQDNESRSGKGVVRGLHWQTGAAAQAKLVRVSRGAALDFAVDIRAGSPTFGRHFTIELSAENKKQLFIPRGFAHGFMVLEDDTVFSYKCDNFYCSKSERGIRFDDPELAIALPDIGVPLLLSEKDRLHPFFKDVAPEHV